MNQSKSPLLDIDGLDLSVCLPQDIMHVLFEGVMEVECRLFLRFCIINKNLFSVADLNSKIDTFDFKHLQKDKPSLILDAHLDNELRQSAS